MITAPHLAKWVHSARFERRLFGRDVVRGLTCTFELARGLTLFRAPLRSLKLATLVQHLFSRRSISRIRRRTGGPAAEH